MSTMVSVSQVADALLTAAAGQALPWVDQIGRFFVVGGPLMFVNLLLLGFAIAVAVERIIVLVIRFNLDAGPFMEQITKLVLTGNVDRAAKLCAAAPHAPLAKVIAAGLRRADRGEPETARAVEEAIVEQTPRVTARIAWLSSLAVIAALLGLIGTVLGVIDALEAVGSVPADPRHLMLAGGIAGALHDTAWALSISAFCVVLHLVLGSYAKRMLDQVELSALKLENLLSRPHPGESPPIDLEKSA
jgi:biopolymer transport protein ExbB